MEKRHFRHIRGINTNVFHVVSIVELPWQLSPWRFLKYRFLGTMANVSIIDQRLIWRLPNLLIICVF